MEPRRAGARPSFNAGLLAMCAVLGATCAFPLSALAKASPVLWEQWHHEPAVFDVAGPLSNGNLVVAAGPHLYELSRDGTSEHELAPAYATGQSAPFAGDEAYIAVTSSTVVNNAACPFTTDTIFSIHPGSPSAVIRVDPSGAVSVFATLPQGGALNGIAFDTAGSFQHRLLVTGAVPGGTAVTALDCHGNATSITTHAPRLEGGLDVAPLSFAGAPGDLLAADELSGDIIAITPTGTSTVLAVDAGPSGQDVGVESVAVVPNGFTSAGRAYTADRITAGSPHPGTDTLLRSSSTALSAAGVRDGDVLLATEGGDRIVDMRCKPCSTQSVGMGQAAAHGEGHLLLIADPLPLPTSPASPTAAATPQPVVQQTSSTGFPVVPVAIGAALLLVGLALGVALLRSRRAGP